MFETVIAAMLKHKQVVLAAIVVTALSGMVVQPIVPVAQAQLGSDIASDVLDSVFGGDDEEAAAEEEEEEEEAEAGVTQGDDSQNIGQSNEQTNEQDQEAENEAEQEVDQENDQSETNVQANELSTGANTATVTQANAAEQDVDASADAAAAAEANSEAESEDDHHDSKGKKKHGYHGSDSDSTTSIADAEAIANAAAEATGIIGQENNAAVNQDSSIHDVDLSNNVNFGDDTNTQVAIPVIDQNIDQDQRAANLGLNLAANLDLDLDEYEIVSLIEGNGPPFGQGGGQGPGG